jgi:hypothetical protein
MLDIQELVALFSTCWQAAVQRAGDATLDETRDSVQHKDEAKHSHHEWKMLFKGYIPHLPKWPILFNPNKPSTFALEKKTVSIRATCTRLPYFLAAILMIKPVVQAGYQDPSVKNPTDAGDVDLLEPGVGKVSETDRWCSEIVKDKIFPRRNGRVLADGWFSDPALVERSARDQEDIRWLQATPMHRLDHGEELVLAVRLAWTAKDVLSKLAKFLVPGSRNVYDSPCPISQEYHDEFN